MLERQVNVVVVVVVVVAALFACMQTFDRNHVFVKSYLNQCIVC